MLRSEFAAKLESTVGLFIMRGMTNSKATDLLSILLNIEWTLADERLLWFPLIVLKAIVSW